MLGFRCRLALGRVLRRGVSLGAGGVVVDGVFTMVRVDRRSGLAFSGESTGDVTGGGVGELALTRGFLAFLLRIFSSSSEEVTSERLEQSTLIASEFLFEIEP